MPLQLIREGTFTIQKISDLLRGDTENLEKYFYGAKECFFMYGLEGTNFPELFKFRYCHCSGIRKGSAFATASSARLWRLW